MSAPAPMQALETGVALFGGGPFTGVAFEEAGGILNDAREYRAGEDRGEYVNLSLVRCLEQRGVDRVFGIPGGTISALYDARLDAKIGVFQSMYRRN